MSFYLLKDIIQFYRSASPQSRETLNDYITELDETMTQLQNDPYEGQTISIPGGCHWSIALWDVIFTKNPRFSSKHTGPPPTLHNFVQSADIFTFTARLGFYQYLKACYRQGISDPSTLVIFASDSWSIIHKENPITLRDRGDTLIFILQHVENIDVKIHGESLFSIAAKYTAPNIQPYEDLSLFRASFITTARSPESLIRSGTDLMRMHDIPLTVHALKTSQDPLNQDLGYKLEQIFARMLESDQLESQKHRMLAVFETMTIGNRAYGVNFCENGMCSPWTSQDDANARTQSGEQYQHRDTQRFDMGLNSTMYKYNPLSLQERNTTFSPLPLRPCSSGITSMQPLMQQFPIQDPSVHQFIPHQLPMQQFPMPNPPLRQFPMMHQLSMQQFPVPNPP